MTSLKIYAKGGDDDALLTLEKKESGDLSRLMYTQHDKMVLCQFEAAAAPAVTFSLFTQDKKHLFLYVLFEARLAIQASCQIYFSMVQGK